MDVRGPRLRKPSDEALEFTSSMAWDGHIARHVIRVNVAHMVALVKSGEVDRVVGARCIAFLQGASSSILGVTKAEDFHQQLEQDAVDSLGVQTAGFLNYGKSRNDQVATAIRMELRERVIAFAETICGLQEVILRLAASHGSDLLPGYTHMQRAQPVTFAHHYLAYFDAFQRDIDRAMQLYSRVNTSPMGGAAMAGTSLKIDRAQTAEYLGFVGLVRNAMDAVSSRDFAVEALSCATMAMLDASRLAEELILWSSSEFGFVELADAYSASSSIMPQKKNAVFAEVVRAKAGSVLGDLVAACTILKALPYSYNLDLQEVTPHVWRGMDDAVSSVKVLAGALSSATFNTEAMAIQVANDNSTAVGLANFLVAEHGFSFRQAHAIVGELVRASLASGKPLHRVASSSLATVSRRFGGRSIVISHEKVRSILDPRSFLEGISTTGGSNPGSVSKETKFRQGQLSSNRSALSGFKGSLKSSERRLNAAASGIAREVKLRD